MTTTTVRVDTETHRRLLALSAASGKSLIETVRDATEALRRQRFATQVAGEFTDLRQNPERWAAYLADAEATDVSDGVS